MTAQVRRFEPGASAFGLDNFLGACGYSICAIGRFYLLRKPGTRGRPKRVSRKALMELLDIERVKQGKEPIVKRGA